MLPKTAFLVTIILFSIILSSVDCIPISPCPMNFHYEYDGKNWIGVAKVYPNIYNRFRTNRMRINLSLTLDRIVSNVGNLANIDLYRSLLDTYLDIAARRPIAYRISFRFDAELPKLLQIYMNGFQVCHTSSHYIKSKIDLQHTFYLPIQSDMKNQTNSKNTIQNDFDLITSKSMQRIQIDERKNKPLKTSNNQCGRYDSEFKYSQLIIGDQNVSPGTWPWSVAIYRKKSQINGLVFQCSGNLITNRLVLTAAHCLKMDDRLEMVSVREIILAFGRHDLLDWTEINSITSDVEKIILHPDYLSQKNQPNIFDADIAILVTRTFINYNTMIRPICLWPLPTKNENFIRIIGMNGTTVGWGQPFKNSDENTPRKLILPVVNKQKCFPHPGNGQGRRVFCAGFQRKGYAPCNGDSGNGFAIYTKGSWYLRGIASAALGDPILNRCESNTLAIFTDIVYFGKWIRNFM